MVWNIEARRREKRLLPLNKLQAKPKRREPQTWQQQLEHARMWTAMMGGTIVQRKDH